MRPIACEQIVPKHVCYDSTLFHTVHDTLDALQAAGTPPDRIVLGEVVFVCT